MKSIREIQCKRIMEQTSKKTVTKLRKVNAKSDEKQKNICSRIDYDDDLGQ